LRSESKVGGKKAEIAGVGSAPLEEWHILVSIRRERKCAITSVPDWFPFPLQISRTAKNKAREMDI